MNVVMMGIFGAATLAIRGIPKKAMLDHGAFQG
jgi:hypothetical protein